MVRGTEHLQLVKINRRHAIHQEPLDQILRPVLASPMRRESVSQVAVGVGLSEGADASRLTVLCFISTHLHPRFIAGKG